MIRRGEVYWVHLDPTIGSEMRKTRPALVISNDLNNLHAQTVTVLPITSATEKVFPFEVLLRRGAIGNDAQNKVKANQIRTVDKRRLGAVLGLIPPETMALVEQAVRLHLDL